MAQQLSGRKRERQTLGERARGGVGPGGDEASTKIRVTRDYLRLCNWSNSRQAASRPAGANGATAATARRNDDDDMHRAARWWKGAEGLGYTDCLALHF